MLALGDSSRMRFLRDDPAATRKPDSSGAEPLWLHYNIHDLVRVRTNVDDFDFPNYFLVKTARPNFEIRLVDRIDLPPVDDARRVGFATFELGNGELLHECDVPLLYLAGSKHRWRTLVRGLDRDPTTIATAVPFFRAVPIRAKAVQMLSRMVRLVMTLKLLGRGFAPFHASSVANDGDALLFFGYGWTGKSTVVGEMVRAGLHFMSDDYSIVDGKGRVYCYPDWHDPHASRLEMPILKYLRVTTAGFRRARDRISRVVKEADVHSISFLEKGPDEVVEIDRDEAARRISLINLEELSKLWNSPLSQIVSQYSYFYPNFNLGRLAERYKSIAMSLADRAEHCNVIRSQSPRFDVVKRLVSRRTAGPSDMTVAQHLPGEGLAPSDSPRLVPGRGPTGGESLR